MTFGRMISDACPSHPFAIKKNSRNFILFRLKSSNPNNNRKCTIFPTFPPPGALLMRKLTLCENEKRNVLSPCSFNLVLHYNLMKNSERERQGGTFTAGESWLMGIKHRIAWNGIPNGDPTHTHTHIHSVCHALTHLHTHTHNPNSTWVIKSLRWVRGFLWFFGGPNPLRICDTARVSPTVHSAPRENSILKTNLREIRCHRDLALLSATTASTSALLVPTTRPKKKTGRNFWNLFRSPPYPCFRGSAAYGDFQQQTKISTDFLPSFPFFRLFLSFFGSPPAGVASIRLIRRYVRLVFSDILGRRFFPSEGRPPRFISRHRLKILRHKRPADLDRYSLTNRPIQGFLQIFIHLFARLSAQIRRIWPTTAPIYAPMRRCLDSKRGNFKKIRFQVRSFSPVRVGTILWFVSLFLFRCIFPNDSFPLSRSHSPRDIYTTRLGLTSNYHSCLLHTQNIFFSILL